MTNNIKNITALFYLEPWIENGKPWFRHFPLRAYFSKLSAHIIANGGTCTLICGEGTNFTINEYGWGFENFTEVIIIDEARLRSISRNYNEFSTLDQKDPANLAQNILAKFSELSSKRYDLAFIWESQANYIKSIFDCPRFVSLSPGMLSREPYPNHITVDLNGFFSESWLANSAKKDFQKFSKKHSSTKKVWPLDTYLDCLKPYFNFSHKNSIPNEVRQKIKLFNKIYCLPLQISDYFATTNEVTGNKQWDLLINVLNAIPKDVGLVVTHYISPGLEEKIINNHNINFLETIYPNLIYSPKLDEITAPSQLLLGLVDGIITISSSIGLQAKLLGKELITIGNSHLSKFSDGGLDSICSEILPHDNAKANFLKHLHGRYFLPSDLIFKNKESIDNFLSKLINCSSDEIPLFFDDSDLEKYYKNTSESQIRLSKEKIITPLNEPPKFATTIIDRIVDKNYKYISFDIFDTLIQRDVFNPAAVFDLVEKKVQSSKFAESLAKLLRDTQSQSFKALRIESERTARNDLSAHNFEDCNFDEIYQEIQNNTIDEELIKFLKQTEIDTELEVIRPRLHGKIIYEMAKASGKKVIFCSDMYLPEKIIKLFLQKNGIYDGEKIYVSSETRLRKHSGNMFLHILHDLNITPKDLYHLGDADHGDYNIPRKYGITASLIPAARNYWLENYGKSYRKYSASNLTEEIIFGGQAAYAYDLPYHAAEKNGYFRGRPEIFGYSIAGPLMVGLCEWLANSLRREKLKNLFFFARDGFVVKRVFEATSLSNLKLNKCEYIHVSRRVLAIAAITSHEDITALVKQRFEPMQLVSFIQIRFGIDLWSLTKDELSNLLKDTDISRIEDVVSTSKYSADLYKIVHRLDKQIYLHASELRKKVTKYFSDIGLISNNIDRVGIFDIGYAGSLQKYIEKIIGSNFIHGFYFATFVGVNELLKKGGVANGYAGEYIDPLTTDLQYVHAVHIFETLFSHIEGSTFNYMSFGDSVTPVRIAEQNHLGKNYFVTQLWRGISDFIETYNKYSPHIDWTQFNWQKSLLPFDDFVNNPKIDDLYILNNVNFENLYCGERSTPIVSYDSPNIRVLWSHGQKYINSFVNDESLHAIKHLQSAKNFESLKEYIQMLYEEQFIKTLIQQHANEIETMENDYSLLQAENKKLNIILNSFIEKNEENKSDKLSSNSNSVLDTIDRWFSEEEYIKANPDVAVAIKDGKFESGLQHFKVHGHEEDRKLFS